MGKVKRVKVKGGRVEGGGSKPEQLDLTAFSSAYGDNITRAEVGANA